ncbi:MAG: hypothetical protein ACHQUB_03545 [Candidatus Saccharimonadia bacterium]
MQLIRDFISVKRNKTFTIVSGICIFILICLIILWRLLNQPAVGKINIPQNSKNSSSQVSITYKALKGQYFSTEYPSTFSFIQMGAQQSNVGMDSFDLATSEINGYSHITFNVQPDNRGILDNPSYHLRVIENNVYRQSSGKVGSDVSYIMTRTDSGYEQTIFFEHHGYLAIISQTSGSNDPNGESQIMQHILENWKWLVP